MLRAGATRRDSSNSGAVTIQGRFYALALGAMVLDGEAAVGDVLLSGGLSLCHQDEADLGGGGKNSPGSRGAPSPRASGLLVSRLAAALHNALL